jgi:acyl carrier protein
MDREIDSEIERILTHDLGLPSDLARAGCLFSDGMLDSFDRIRLVELLQEKFKIDIDWSELIPENLDSISAMAQLVKTTQTNRP